MSEQRRRVFFKKVVFDWDFQKQKEDLLQIGTDDDCVKFDD